MGFEQANQLTSHYVISLCMILYSCPVSRTFLKGKNQFFTYQNPRIFFGNTFLKFRIVNHTYLRTKKGQKKIRVIYTLKEDEPRLIRTRYYNIGIGDFSRMAGALIGMRALITKNTVEGGRLFERGFI